MTCEIGKWTDPQHYARCENEATHYVMNKGSGSWAGYACADHAWEFSLREELVAL